MKQFIFGIIILTLVSYSLEAKETKIKWMSLNEAIELNKTKPKSIFIDVYTNWCSWCKRMDTSTFENQRVVEYMNKTFYCVKFNAEGNDTITFRGKKYFNTKKKGKRSTHPFAAILLQGQMTYPSFVILDKNLRGAGLIKGYKKANNFYVLLKFFATGSYKTETLEEYKAKLKKEEEN